MVLVATPCESLDVCTSFVIHSFTMKYWELLGYCKSGGAQVNQQHNWGEGGYFMTLSVKVSLCLTN
jgi:hypothetical protein